MFYKIEDFIKTFYIESKSTLKLFKELTDESLSQKVYNDGRTLGRIAWHIVITHIEMLSKAGIKVSGPEENSSVPVSAQEIYEAYKLSSRSVLEMVKSTWNDDQLNDLLDMYGEQWSKGLTLRVLINHEIHHRAQMTILMRQAGLIIPGLYGPAKEEWTSFGMSPAE